MGLIADGLHDADEELVDLRRRIAATRWPEKETVADQSQGVQLATIQELARYWATDYAWRNCEAKLNALPQFMIEIDGENIFLMIDTNNITTTQLWIGPVINVGWERCIGCTTRTSKVMVYAGTADVEHWKFAFRE